MRRVGDFLSDRVPAGARRGGRRGGRRGARGPRGPGGGRGRASPDDAFDFLSLARRWDRVVGARLARATAPLKHKNGVLVVLSDHPALSQELSLMQNLVIEKIAALFPGLKGKVRRLGFRVNESFFRERREREGRPPPSPGGGPGPAPLPHPQSPEGRRWRKEALEAFGGVRDDELREALVSLHAQVRAARGPGAGPPPPREGPREGSPP